MRKRNSVAQLGKTHSHRKAMFSNLVTALFENEEIVTTKQKAKELQIVSEKLITRAKYNINTAEESKKLHNKREAMKVVKDRDIIKKLFDDIAIRNKDRNGGYTRIYLMGSRNGDCADMVKIELVEKKAN